MLREREKPIMPMLRVEKKSLNEKKQKVPLLLQHSFTVNLLKRDTCKTKEG
jgi:hypothetical protein